MDLSPALAMLGLSTPSSPPLPPGLEPAAWGTQGHRWAFFFEQPDRAGLERSLELVRAYVNAQYRLPRCVRFRSPQMVLVALVQRHDADLEELVTSSPSSTIWGGEIFHLVTANLRSGEIVHLDPRGAPAARRVEALRLRIVAPDSYARAALRVLRG